MDISYRLNNNQIEKLKKYKNPSIILKKENILKNGKYKLHVFTDKRKEYYLQEGGSLANIFKSFVPYLKPIAKKSFLLLELQRYLL